MAGQNSKGQAALPPSIKMLLSPLELPVVEPGVQGLLLLLAVSFLLLLLAPLMMPAGYSWITHTTSESAAQGLVNAWIARLGFLLLGFAVLWLSLNFRNKWARLATWMLDGSRCTFFVLEVPSYRGGMKAKRPSTRRKR